MVARHSRISSDSRRGSDPRHRLIDIKTSPALHQIVRTTLTLDDDVAMRLEQERRRRRVSGGCESTRLRSQSSRPGARARPRLARRASERDCARRASMALAPCIGTNRQQPGDSSKSSDARRSVASGEGLAGLRRGVDPTSRRPARGSAGVARLRGVKWENPLAVRS
jgi:hypothetical protein